MATERHGRTYLVAVPIGNNGTALAKGGKQKKERDPSSIYGLHASGNGIPLNTPKSKECLR